MVHLAFLVMGRLTREVNESVNIGGSRRVFSACVEAGVPAVVYTSSIAAYGALPGHPEPLVEDSPRRDDPSFPYAHAKTVIEAHLDELEQAHPQMRIVRLRPGILVGRRMPHTPGRLLARGLMLDLGDTPLPLVWDEDVADAVVLALRNENSRGAYNVVAADPLPVAALAPHADLRILRLSPRLLVPLARLSPMLELLRLGQSVDPAWFRALSVRVIPSSKRALDELGWQPSCPTCIDVVERLGREATRRLDKRLATFMRLWRLSPMPEGMVQEIKHVDLKIQLELTGRAGGDFKIHLDHGRTHVTPGRFRPPEAIITLSAETFLDMLAGRQDAITAEMTGRIRVSGEAFAARILTAVVTQFRALTRQKGYRGWVARRLEGRLTTPLAPAQVG